MKKVVLIIMLGILVGALFLTGYNVLMRYGLFVPSHNYWVTGFLGNFVYSLLRQFAVLILGIYVGSALSWLYLNKGIVWGVGKLDLFRYRLFMVIMGAIIFAFPLVFMTIKKQSGFPGENAPISMRHKWATKKLGAFYLEAIEYLKTSDVVREKIGEIKEIAPTVGRNSVGSGLGEVYGHFTLELLGNKGKAIANVEFFNLLFSGELIFDNEVLQLEAHKKD